MVFKKSLHLLLWKKVVLALEGLTANYIIHKLNMRQPDQGSECEGLATLLFILRADSRLQIVLKAVVTPIDCYCIGFYLNINITLFTGMLDHKIPNYEEHNIQRPCAGIRVPRTSRDFYT